MKIKIRPQGITLNRTQRARLERELDLALARFGDRIDRVIVDLADGDVAGITSCAIEVRFKPQIVRVEDADPDVSLAVEYAARRVARSVSRALETEALLRR